MRVPWPFHRRQAPVAREVDDAAAAPAGAPAVQAEPFEPDAGLMAELSERAEERDALPILGPQGGLSTTARFLTVAREMAEGFPAASWSQEVVDSAQPPETVASDDFITTLSSLSSFRDPAGIVSGESEGSPFPEWGSAAASTGVFAGAAGAPEGMAEGRPRPGGAASQSSIIARLADRRGTESPAPAVRRESTGRAASSEGARPAPAPSETPPRQTTPVRRGLVTEPAASAPATPATSDSPAAQPHVQRVTELPTPEVTTPASPAEVPAGPAPPSPPPTEEAPQDVERAAERTAEPPMQVARLAEAPSSPEAPPPDQGVPAEEAPSLTPVAGRTPIEAVEMPLATTETRPGQPGEPVAGDVVSPATPDVVARLSSVLTPAEMGVRPNVTEGAPASQPAPASEDVPPGPRVISEAPPELPLASAPQSVPGAQADSPADGPRRAVPSPGPQGFVPSPAGTPVRRSTEEEIETPGAQSAATSLENGPPASPAVSGAGEFARQVIERQVIDLSQPLLLTEPWAAGAPDDRHQQIDEGSAFDSPLPEPTELTVGPRSVESPPLQPRRAMPASAVSRGVESPGEPSPATPMPWSQPGGRAASPGGVPPGSGEPRTGRAPTFESPGAQERTSPSILREFRPVGRLAGLGEDESSPWSPDRPPVAAIEDEAPGAWLGSASQESWNELELPALELSPTPAARGTRESSPAMARPFAARDRGSATSAVSRLADLPLAPVPAVMREGEAAQPEAAAAEPAAGAVGTVAPAGPPAAAASEGDIDKLAERVWQVVRRRLQIERERQRGLP